MYDLLVWTVLNNTKEEKKKKQEREDNWPQQRI